MEVFIYAKSGHKIGLDRVRSSVVVAKKLQNLQINTTLATSDFRAATNIKEYGFNKTVGIDIFQNMPNLANKGDIILYNTDEVDDNLKKGVEEFCSYSLDISDKIFVDDIFRPQNKTIENLLFFGDDDYDKKLVNLLNSKLNFDLLIGEYFFLGYEDELKPYFNNIYEEDYVEIINSSKNILTSSFQTALEGIQSGAKVVLYKREDKEYNDKLIKDINIPIINNFNEFEDIINNYPNLNPIPYSNIDLSKIEELYNKHKNLFRYEDFGIE